jgi:hypothetical protein
MFSRWLPWARMEEPMNGINFKRTYPLGEAYENIKQRAHQALEKYLGYPGLIAFNDPERSVTFSSERLVPTIFTNRRRVMLLFSNPHPYSVYKGMFLSRNTNGQESLFWPGMRGAGWMTFAAENLTPQQLANTCLHAGYQGPFDLIFYCYYAFPTEYPEHLRKIFGKDYFQKQIAPQALEEFRGTIQEHSVEAVVTFNKGIFNLVSQAFVERYIERLKRGELIQSRIDGIQRDLPIFLSYPTGWRYDPRHLQFRVDNLVEIKNAISGMTFIQPG